VNQKRKDSMNGSVEVPVWVMAVTYFMCWAFGLGIVVGEITGWLSYRPLLLALAIYLIFWPVVQLPPQEILKRIFPR
jgi:hypothetical protein